MKRYPSDRPFTLEELVDIGYFRRSTWIVEFFGIRRLCRVGDFVFEQLKQDFGSTYDMEWRAWPYRPSDELRATTPWVKGKAEEAEFLYRAVREAMRPYHQITKRPKATRAAPEEMTE